MNQQNKAESIDDTEFYKYAEKPFVSNFEYKNLYVK